MLNSFRDFGKSIWAKILLFIIIIPFVFWGMGGAFRGAGKNTIAKVNNYNISAQNFMEYINSLNLNPDTIRENINNSIIEQILSELINKTILSLESKDLNIILSDHALAEIIKSDEKFIDSNKLFSRTQYEKFLISKNFSAIFYEEKLKEKQINKMLFDYISGGTFSPSFLVKNTFDYQNKKISVQAINLNPLYKKKQDFSETDIKKYMDNNRELLEENFISFRFSLINPMSIIDAEEYNELFFEKIDQIENLIINGESYEEIIKSYNLKFDTVKLINKDGYNENGILQKKINRNLINKIFELKAKEVKSIFLLEHENEYALVITDEIKKLVQNISSGIFKNKIVNTLINRDIFEYNQKLIAKIKTNSFSELDFIQLAKKNKIGIKDILINGIKDNNFFSPESNRHTFSLPAKSFSLATGKQENETFLILLKEIKQSNLQKDSNEYNKYYSETVTEIKNNIYSTFDLYMAQKYEVEINYQTLDRIKNYFR